jgi:hypothetical protein
VQLSQHLFAVQMGMHLCVAENVPLYQSKSDLAVYRANYSTALLPGVRWGGYSLMLVILT